MPPKRAKRGSDVGSKRPSSPILPADDDAPDNKRFITECGRLLYAKLQLNPNGTKYPFASFHRYLTQKQGGGKAWVALEMARMCGMWSHATVDERSMEFDSLRINIEQKMKKGEGGTIIPKHVGPNPITIAILANRLDVAELIVKEEDFRPEMLNAVVASRNRTALHCCAEACNTEGILFLVGHGADINYFTDSKKGTPLLLAVRLGLVQVVELLISLGAIVKSYPKMPCPYLHLASSRGWCDIVEVLLDTNKGNADIDEVDPVGNTALHRSSCLEVTNLLLSRGASVNVENLGARTALHNASANPKSLVTNFLDLGAEVDVIDNYLASSLLVACNRDNEPAALALLENGAQVTLNCEGVGPLCSAAEIGWFHLLRIIAGRYPHDLNSESVKSEWDRALVSSLGFENEDPEMVLFLIERGADVNAVYRGRYPLELAILFWNVDIVKALLTKGADILVAYENGRNAMQMAVDRNELDFVRAIVDARGYGALEVESSNPPWLDAARSGQIEMFRELVRLTLSGTIDPTSFLSKRYQCIETEEIVGDAQRRAKVSGTVLHFAASINDAETIEQLINLGADVNMCSEYDGSCPLHIAVQFNATACVNVLVAKGADMYAVDMLGNTPLQTACVVAGVLGTPLEAMIKYQHVSSRYNFSASSEK